MTNVLIVAAAVPAEPTILRERLRTFRDKGATVALACYFAADQLPVDESLADVRSFARPVEGLTPRLRKAIGRTLPSRQVWLHASRDPWVRERARRADVLVAIDPLAVHAIWELAQRCPRADAVYGQVPALRALDRRAAEGPPTTAEVLRRRAVAPVSIAVRGLRWFGVRIALGVARRATGRRVMRTVPGAWLWRAAVVVPGVPDRLRTKLATRVHSSLLRAERPAFAKRVTASVLRRLRSAESRADLLAGEASEELKLGGTTVNIEAAVTAQLSQADALFRKDPARAAKALSKAMSLISNRVLHFDRPHSPLVDDPDAFLAPLRRSAAVAKLAEPRGRARPAAPRPTRRPLRLLLATVANDNFLGEIRERYERRPDVEVRFLDLYADPSRHRLIHAGEAVMGHVLAGGSPYGQEVEQWLRPHLDWADTVFVDWCQAQAALFTLIDPGTTRVVVRLHSFEAFNFWPHLVDFSRVDDMVFVSEHLRDLTATVHPRLTSTYGPRLHVISNAMDLRRCQRGDKHPDTRFTLGLVGVAQVTKDPLWAIEVLRLVRDQDPRYRLMLIGKLLKPDASTAARQYHGRLQQQLAELEPAGTVIPVGQTDDAPRALEQVGVILSTSLRESFHCGLVEGAASGAVPVVRDWPFFAGKPHGARTLFPADWVVETPEEAARRVLSVTATEEAWRKDAASAAAHAVQTWDWTTVRHRFDELLLGGQALGGQATVGGTSLP